jgi:hypothetical protein
MMTHGANIGASPKTLQDGAQ